MKMPKKQQLYDVCMLSQSLSSRLENRVDYTIRHLSTLHYNIPIAMAKFYVKVLTRNQKDKCTFFIYVKNGLDPLKVIRERKEKALQRKILKESSKDAKDIERHRETNETYFKQCAFCNGIYNPNCTEQANCLNVSMEAEQTMKRLGLI